MGTPFIDGVQLQNASAEAFCSLNRPAPGKNPACESGGTPNIHDLPPLSNQNSR
jgi:hypothetical protein